MRIGLRNNVVHKLTAFFAPFHDNSRIVGRDHDERELSDVISQPGVLLLVFLKNFLLIALEATGDGFIHSRAFKVTLHHKPILPLLDLLGIYWIKIALA